MKSSVTFLTTMVAIWLPACTGGTTSGPTPPSAQEDSAHTDAEDTVDGVDGRQSPGDAQDPVDTQSPPRRDTAPLLDGTPSDAEPSDTARPPAEDTSAAIDSSPADTEPSDTASPATDAADDALADVEPSDTGTTEADTKADTVPADTVLADSGAAEVVAEDTGGTPETSAPDGNTDAGVDIAEDTGELPGNGPVIEGCEPMGPGEYIHSVEFVPASPDNCSETVVIIHGVHPGLGYGFGTTNTGKCQPPFNCGVEAKLTLSLSASKNGDNPDGPEYAHELSLGTLEAYNYCVVGKYSAPNGISETIQATIEVTACP